MDWTVDKIDLGLRRPPADSTVFSWLPPRIRRVEMCMIRMGSSSR